MFRTKLFALAVLGSVTMAVAIAVRRVRRRGRRIVAELHAPIASEPAAPEISA